MFIRPLLGCFIYETVPTNHFWLAPRREKFFRSAREAHDGFMTFMRSQLIGFVFEKR